MRYVKKEGKKKIVNLHSKNIHVGDIIKIYENSEVPADLVLLTSSNEDGECFLKTTQLDGESNLKLKKCLKETYMLKEEDLSDFTAYTECEQTNPNLLDFNGRIYLGDDAETKENDSAKPLSVEQLILKGTILKNTSFIFGMVVYTGRDTKIMKNINKVPHKISNLEFITNFCVLAIFTFEIILILVFAFGIGIFISSNSSKFWYLFGDGTRANAVQSSFESIIANLCLFSNIIPISVFISMEISKLVQSNFLKKDPSMFYVSPENVAKPPKINNFSLIEDLGQVQFIFTDKTGTLTQNRMEFKKFSVDGIVYGENYNEKFLNENSEFNDISIDNYEYVNLKNSKDIEEFFLLLSLCHTSIIETNENGESKINSSSPDEGAFLKQMKIFGYEMIKRTNLAITLNIRNIEKKFNILAVLPFNSDRKRMSIIIEDEDNNIILYTKGADNKMLKVITKNCSSNTNNILDQFSVDGLRTLVCAKKLLTRNEFESWYSEFFQPALISLKNKEEAINFACDKMEKDLTFIGITALEDKIQDGLF
jgi:phospholipid-translocating P-type ATPase (flippase)